MSQLSLGEPVHQIEIHPGNKPCLSYTEQKSQKVQMGCCPHEASQDCHNSPTDQYPRNPDTSAKLMQKKVARYFKNEIAPKEYARQQSELLACDRQLLIHR